MAYSFLKALGCDGDLGTITLDMRGGRATATGGHKVLSASPAGLQVESTRYPFCFQGDPAKPEATTGVIEFLPFNQDLNRLTFVVRNASTAKLKVTWGETSKVFTAEQLAHGINLAAEFMVNPFSGPFQKVHEAVLRQQNFETPMVKEMLHALPDLKKIDGGKDLPLDALRANLVAIDQGLRKAAVASVVPVKHEIHVEAVTE
jgi:hypothetical protein